MRDVLAVYPPSVHHFAAAGQGVGSLEAESWRVAAAGVTGPSHRARQLECDDAVAATVAEGWLVAVVCDGAGSARCGGTAAALATRSVMETARANLPRRDSDLRNFAAELLARAHNELEATAVEQGLPLSEYATTILGVISNGAVGILFHLGDGAALVVDSESLPQSISRGTPSEYVNETYFLSSPDWNAHVQFTELGPFAHLFLMTDGVTPFALDGDTFNKGFILPIISFVTSEQVEVSAAALGRMLDSEQAQRSTSDDKTLLWAAPIYAQLEQAPKAVGQTAEDQPAQPGETTLCGWQEVPPRKAGLGLRSWVIIALFALLAAVLSVSRWVEKPPAHPKKPARTQAADLTEQLKRVEAEWTAFETARTRYVTGCAEYRSGLVAVADHLKERGHPEEAKWRSGAGSLATKEGSCQ